MAAVKHTPGTWRAFFNQPDESGAVTCSIYAEPDMSNPHRGYVADVYRNHVGSFIDDEEFRANARLIAAAPDLLEALRLHKAWADSERAGPDYGGQTRDSHPDGERIWRAWWDNQIDLCDRANRATDAAIAKATGETR